MTRQIADQTIDSAFDQDSGRTYDDLLIERCEFDWSAIVVNSVNKRTRIRHVTLRQCAIVTNCSLGPAIVEDVLVDNCPKRPGSSGLIHIAGPALRHVTLRGKIAPFNLIFSVEKPDPSHTGSIPRLIPAPEFMALRRNPGRAIVRVAWRRGFPRLPRSCGRSNRCGDVQCEESLHVTRGS